MLSRRSFFKFLGGAVAGAVAAKVLPAVELDLEKALWLPGKKTIFIPELIARPLDFIGLPNYTKETLKALTRQLTFGRWMIDGRGLIVPVTAEGYRAGYQIYYHARNGMRMMPTGNYGFISPDVTTVTYPDPLRPGCPSRSQGVTNG